MILRFGLLAVMLLAATPASAQQAGRWSKEIAQASGRFHLPEEWIRQVMKAESGGSAMLKGQPITSRAGAMGLMQLMPGTWADMRRTFRLGNDPYDPRDNILAGTAYLRAMYDRFGYPGLFAAYNAGPHYYARHLASLVPLPAETSAYLTKVLERRPAPGAESAASAREREPSVRGDRLALQRADPDALFVVRIKLVNGLAPVSSATSRSPLLAISGSP